MARCYVELKDGKADVVFVQDETGVYAGAVDKFGRFGFGMYEEPIRMLIKLPEWQDARIVRTTERDWLEFHRTFERSGYTATVPTEIFEIPGAARDVIRQAFDRYA